MGGGPCEVCSPNRALTESSTPLAEPQKFDGLPQGESEIWGVLV